MFISPWLMAASIGLLVLIIAIFATNNFQKGKQLVTEGLFHKGQMAVRFVGAGMRASMMMGGRSSAQTQQLIEQASQEEDIYYITVVDGDGKIVAHSDPAMIGQTISRDLDFLRDTPPIGKWHIVSSSSPPPQTFEVVSPFNPFRHGRGRLMKKRLRHMMQDTNNSDTNPLSPNDWCDLFLGENSFQPTTGHMILVGLDMKGLDNIIRQHRYNIIIMSIVLLLVGLGGWISLLAAQSYKTSQEALSQIQAFTGMLISRIPMGIIAISPEGRIKTFNHAAETMTGKNAHKALNREPAEVLPPILANLFTTTQEDEEILDHEVALPAPENKTLTLHISSVPVPDQNGAATGRVLLMHDLTKLKNLEKEMQRHDRLIALGKMAAGVAHEVRNPLSSIKGFATLLGSRFNKNSQEQETAELLVNEVERLNRSISELLNYARPLPLKLIKLDLHTIIPSSLMLIETDAKEFGINISHEIDPETPPIIADPDRLNQVLLNLYLNALQAMKHEGRLTVHVRKGGQGMVSIEIKDTGIGIPEESLKRILDPYFTTKPGGTGLGLAIVNKILDEHGGTIQFTSKVNEGTTVTISLPMDKKAS